MPRLNQVVDEEQRMSDGVVAVSRVNYSESSKHQGQEKIWPVGLSGTDEPTKATCNESGRSWGIRATRLAEPPL